MHFEFRQHDRERCRALHSALTQGGLPVPALSACGRGTREIRYTQLLAYYLDPTRPHGLGTRILEALFGPNPWDALGAPVRWQDAEVLAEFDLESVQVEGRDEGCRIDLLVRLGDAVLLVEHKILASVAVSGREVRTTQLARYTQALEQHHPEWARRCRKYLMAPRVRETREDGDWTVVTHEEAVQRLSPLLRLALSPMARHNLAALLLDLVTGPLAEDEDLWQQLAERIARVLEDDRHLLAFRRWVAEHVRCFDSLLDIAEVCR